MRIKFVLLLLILVLVGGACSSGEEPEQASPTAVSAPAQSEGTAVSTTADEPTSAPALEPTTAPEPTATAVPQQPATLPPAETPTGTSLVLAGSEMVLSHADFGWTVTLPATWIITDDSGYQLLAQSPDGALSVRIQAQRWETAEKRLPNARAYVDHWKNFAYGDVFPLYADGQMVSESEVAGDKFGGPYLQYEFQDSDRGFHYSQVYASAGGPNSAVLTVSAVEAGYAGAQTVIQAILASFELLEIAE